MLSYRNGDKHIRSKSKRQREWIEYLISCAEYQGYVTDNMSCEDWVSGMQCWLFQSGHKLPKACELSFKGKEV